MAKRPLTAPTQTKKRKPAQTAVAERTLPDTHSHYKLLLEPLEDRKVKIIEAHRRRDNESRYSRVKELEGHVYAYEQLKLEPTFEELFPQAELFTAAD